MPPQPEPTAEQVVSVMEIMGENSYGLVSELVNDGTGDEADAKWAATLADISEWNEKVKGKYYKLNGEVEVDSETRAGKIRARVRERYGLTSQVSPEVTGEYPVSFAVRVEAW